MSKYPNIIKISNAFKPVFPNCKFEYAREGYIEKGNKLTGREVNPARGWNYRINAKDLIMRNRPKK